MSRWFNASLKSLCLLGLLVLSQPLFAEEAPEKSKPAAKQADAETQAPSNKGTKGDKKPAEKPRYVFRQQHDPNGIGKFYMGREIAHVMGFPAAVWLERPEREDEEAPSKLVKALNLQPGQTVADIGAGSGVLSIMMAKVVGDTGKVLAVDVQQEMLDLLEKKLTAQMISNVEGRLGTETTPNLEAETIDLAIMVDVYHEFAFPYEMMLEISKSLKPGGRVVFVEYRKEDPEVPIKLVHKMTSAQVKREISQPEFGLKWKENIGILPRQHIIIYEKPLAAKPGEPEATPNAASPKKD